MIYRNLIVFLKKSLALNEDLKIEKDIDESPNYKKNKSSLESEVSWWYGTIKKKIITMSNNEIELVAAFCIAHPPLHLLKNLVISKSVCYLYKTIFF